MSHKEWPCDHIIEMKPGQWWHCLSPAGSVSPTWVQCPACFAKRPIPSKQRAYIDGLKKAIQLVSDYRPSIQAQTRSQAEWGQLICDVLENSIRNEITEAEKI
ncbi:hypothetical protein IID24_03205 [Patescibacteria group bacterium]|nr:hypothetical protein [Patescibacteria group bacterium]